MPNLKALIVDAALSAVGVVFVAGWLFPAMPLLEAALYASLGAFGIIPARIALGGLLAWRA